MVRCGRSYLRRAASTGTATARHGADSISLPSPFLSPPLTPAVGLAPGRVCLRCGDLLSDDVRGAGLVLLADQVGGRRGGTGWEAEWRVSLESGWGAA